MLVEYYCDFNNFLLLSFIWIDLKQLFSHLIYKVNIELQLITLQIGLIINKRDQTSTNISNK